MCDVSFICLCAQASWSGDQQVNMQIVKTFICCNQISRISGVAGVPAVLYLLVFEQN